MEKQIKSILDILKKHNIHQDSCSSEHVRCASAKKNKEEINKKNHIRAYFLREVRLRKNYLLLTMPNFLIYVF